MMRGSVGWKITTHVVPIGRFGAKLRKQTGASDERMRTVVELHVAVNNGTIARQLFGHVTRKPGDEALDGRHLLRGRGSVLARPSGDLER
jgi:hypothetical protein